MKSLIFNSKSSCHWGGFQFSDKTSVRNTNLFRSEKSRHTTNGASSFQTKLPCETQICLSQREVIRSETQICWGQRKVVMSETHSCLSQWKVIRSETQICSDQSRVVISETQICLSQRKVVGSEHTHLFRSEKSRTSSTRDGGIAEACAVKNENNDFR